MKTVFNTALFNRYAFCVILFLITSCTNTKNATYFYGSGEGTIKSNTPLPESIIRKNDILNITITSLNPDAYPTTPQEGGVANPNIPAAAGTTSHLIDSDGFITLPLLGNIKADGLTKTQLKENIVKGFIEKELLKDPIVTIRFVNFRVTVLGEVNNPTVVPVPNEKISLLEAIGLAGDLTIYARRDNVMILREENNQKIIKRLDLNTSDLFSSPYYYLKSNDIVYVEPNKARVASSSRSNQWLPIVISGLTLLAIIADRVIK